MNVLKDKKNTVRRIIQLRLEELAWSKIHEILDVDQETAKRYFDLNINNLDEFRTERSRFQDIAKQLPHISAFGFQSESEIFLAKDAVPYSLNERRTEKESKVLTSKWEKHYYSRCRQLYLEGMEKVELSDLLGLSLNHINDLLSDKDFHKNFRSKMPASCEAIPESKILADLPRDIKSGKHIFYHRYSKIDSKKERVIFYSIQVPF